MFPHADTNASLSPWAHNPVGCGEHLNLMLIKHTKFHHNPAKTVEVVNKFLTQTKQPIVGTHACFFL